MKLFVLGSDGLLHRAYWKFVTARDVFMAPTCNKMMDGGARSVAASEMADLVDRYQLCSKCDWESVSDVRFLKE